MVKLTGNSQQAIKAPEIIGPNVLSDAFFAFIFGPYDQSVPIRLELVAGNSVTTGVGYSKHIHFYYGPYTGLEGKKMLKVFKFRGRFKHNLSLAISGEF